jgi:Ca2+/H+ antiporter, TMEM165/GDT1 family
MKNMMWHGVEGKKFWYKRIIFIPIAIVLFGLAAGFIVMFLWNSILPGVIGVHTITFWQAAGILVLSKILFGGFHGKGGHHRFHGHSREMRERWMQLTPEEREKLRNRWWGRFDHPEKEE